MFYINTVSFNLTIQLRNRIISQYNFGKITLFLPKLYLLNIFYYIYYKLIKIGENS